MAFKIELHGVTMESTVNDRSKMTVEGKELTREQVADLATFLIIIGVGNGKLVDEANERMADFVISAMRATELSGKKVSP